MAAIIFRSVSKSFADTPVLSGLDLEVADGEFLAVVGRSGSGKSTLLRIVAGLEPASSGTVTSTDKIAIAFQEPRLLPWLTVVDNVTFGLPRRGRAEVGRLALTEVGLADKADAWPLTLSGGQAQRVSLARALVREPRVLLLDEPFGALDALTRLDMQNLVGELWLTHGWTVVMITHDVDEAVRLADRVVVIGDGAVSEEFRVPGRGPRPPESQQNARLGAQLLRSLGVLTAPVSSPATVGCAAVSGRRAAGAGEPSSGSP